MSLWACLHFLFLWIHQSHWCRTSYWPHFTLAAWNTLHTFNPLVRIWWAEYPGGTVQSLADSRTEPSRRNPTSPWLFLLFNFSSQSIQTVRSGVSGSRTRAWLDFCYSLIRRHAQHPRTSETIGQTQNSTRESPVCKYWPQSGSSSWRANLQTVQEEVLHYCQNLRLALSALLGTE